MPTPLEMLSIAAEVPQPQVPKHDFDWASGILSGAHQIYTATVNYQAAKYTQDVNQIMSLGLKNNETAKRIGGLNDQYTYTLALSPAADLFKKGTEFLVSDEAATARRNKAIETLGVQWLGSYLNKPATMQEWTSHVDLVNSTLGSELTTFSEDYTNKVDALNAIAQLQIPQNQINAALSGVNANLKASEALVASMYRAYPNPGYDDIKNLMGAISQILGPYNDITAPAYRSLVRDLMDRGMSTETWTQLKSGPLGGMLDKNSIEYYDSYLFRKDIESKAMAQAGLSSLSPAQGSIDALAAEQLFRGVYTDIPDNQISNPQVLELKKFNRLNPFRDKSPERIGAEIGMGYAGEFTQGLPDEYRRKVQSVFIQEFRDDFKNAVTMRGLSGIGPDIIPNAPEILVDGNGNIDPVTLDAFQSYISTIMPQVGYVKNDIYGGTAYVNTPFSAEDRSRYKEAASRMNATARYKLAEVIYNGASRYNDKLNQPWQRPIDSSAYITNILDDDGTAAQLLMMNIGAYGEQAYKVYDSMRTKNPAAYSDIWKGVGNYLAISMGDTTNIDSVFNGVVSLYAANLIQANGGELLNEIKAYKSGGDYQMAVSALIAQKSREAKKHYAMPVPVEALVPKIGTSTSYNPYQSPIMGFFSSDAEISEQLATINLPAIVEPPISLGINPTMKQAMDSNMAIIVPSPLKPLTEFQVYTAINKDEADSGNFDIPAGTLFFEATPAKKGGRKWIRS